MTDSSQAKFVFVICQSGAEQAARKEILALPGFRLAFSLPGFLTFKVAPDVLPDRFTLPLTLARTWGWSAGKVIGEDGKQLADQIFEQIDLTECKNIHVFERETAMPGTKGFEPGISPLAASIGELFEAHPSIKGKNINVNRVAGVDEKVIDVVLVKPNEWWFGYHFALTKQGRWPGGVPSIDTTNERTSRAYFKLKEALLWSGIKIEPGDKCAEIGSAPGGACELLLEMGANVLAIDPAEMEPAIEAHENLTYVRRRGHEVKKKDFKGVKWLVADLSMAPKYTLDTVRDIVAHEVVNLSGIVLTLKLSDWSEVADIPEMIKAVKKMGFQFVKTRQLAFNRQEFCLVAAKDKFAIRAAIKKKKTP